jgi:hypothetical protein
MHAYSLLHTHVVRTIYYRWIINIDIHSHFIKMITTVHKFLTYTVFVLKHENSGKSRHFWKIPKFPENPGISENVGENFRDFGENFFSEFRKFQNWRKLFREISCFL